MFWTIAGLLAAATAGGAGAAWSFEDVIDPMTDLHRGIAVADGADASLIIKCDDNGEDSIYFTITSKKYYYGKGSNAFRKFRYRVDAMAPTDTVGYHDGRSVTVIHPRPGTPAHAMLENISGGNRLVVEVASYEGDLYTSVINIQGAHNVIKKVASTCKDTGWLK